MTLDFKVQESVSQTFDFNFYIYFTNLIFQLLFNIHTRFTLLYPSNSHYLFLVQVMETFCVNVWVGAIQLCTVTFMLVGWFWSFVWGIYMIILSGKIPYTFSLVL